MRQFTIYILVLTIFLPRLAAQVPDSSRFVKPLKIKPFVSGSFGELRSNHFHSGLDLTTNRKTGYRVYASDNGYVARIKVSPYGYGKAIYINHADGYTTVYAHLENYAPRIDSLVQARQYAEESFALELFFKAGELPVKRGEVIAYSGNSGGSGGPHLHYEVREQATQKPINPLRFRNDIADNVRPQIQGIKFYCLDENASVSGRREDKYVPTVFYDKAFHPKGSKIFTAHGKIGLGVQVIDYFSGSWRKCGITSIDLWVNDTLVYNFNIDKFSFAETRYLNAHIDYAEKRRSGKVIQKSFVEANNRLSLYNKKNSYTTILKPGDIKECSYKIIDYAGNVSRLNFTIKGEEAPNPLQLAPSPLLKVNCKKSFQLDTLDMQLHIPANTFYTDIDLFIHKEEKAGFVTPIYHIGDNHIPLHKAFTLRIPVPDSLLKHRDKLLMAGVTPQGKTFSAGGQCEGQELICSTRSFGRFTLAIDSVPPLIKLHKAPQNNNYAGRKTIQFTMRDSFSGIQHYECRIDGQWALFEYDAKNDRLIGHLKNIPFLTKGEHQLSVKVRDNKNNTSTKTYTFSY
ncbi:MULTISPECIES: M23 family metallopeptidase [unclassified Carboxylicivirga]|uniref:M23 family metallopeptidase n=1 Tax=Carboxylicivirga TaxID=1628153 RepID=UPI003D3595C9